MEIPLLHGARGLTAHELLERKFEAEERREQARLQAQQAWQGLRDWASDFFRKITDWAEQFTVAWTQALRATIGQMLRHKPSAFFEFLRAVARTQKRQNRRAYWQSQRARLARLEARGALLPRQKMRFRLARANM